MLNSRQNKRHKHSKLTTSITCDQTTVKPQKEQLVRGYHRNIFAISRICRLTTFGVQKRLL